MSNTKHVTIAVVFCAFAISTSDAMASGGGLDPEKDVVASDITITVGTPIGGEQAPPEIDLVPPQSQSKNDLAIEPGALVDVDTLSLDNWCDHPIQVAIYAKYQSSWFMWAWYQLATYEGPVEINALSTHQFVYYYAVTTDGSGIEWGGDTWLNIPGYGAAGFGVWDTTDVVGNYTLEFHC